MSNYRVFYRSVKSADTHHRVNEDCYMHVQYYMMNDAKINVLAVADGMGGLSNGETASRSAVAGALESVHRELLRRYQDSRGKNFSMTHHIEWLEAAARTALEDANEAVCATAEPGVETGTTLSLLLHMGDCAVAANVGDSPIYYYPAAEKELVLVSEIQTKAEMEACAGRYERFSQEYYEQSHIIMNSLGSYTKLPQGSVSINVLEDVRHGDMFLIGSDGAFGRLKAEDILELLEEEQGDVFLGRLFFEAGKDKEDDQTAVLYMICEG